MKRYIDHNDDGSWSIMEGNGVSAEIGRLSIGQKVIIESMDGCCDAVEVKDISIHMGGIEIGGIPLNEDDHYGYSQEIQNIRSIQPIIEGSERRRKQCYDVWCNAMASICIKVVAESEEEASRLAEVYLENSAYYCEAKATSADPIREDEQYEFEDCPIGVVNDDYYD